MAHKTLQKNIYNCLEYTPFVFKYRVNFDFLKLIYILKFNVDKNAFTFKQYKFEICKTFKITINYKIYYFYKLNK